jgi:PAS domain S-box-containing protein
MGAFYWTFTESMLRDANTPFFAYMWLKLTFLWVFLPAVAFHFILIFTKSSLLLRGRWIYVLIYAPAALFGIIELATSLITTTPVLRYWGYTYSYSPNPLPFLVEMAWALGILVVSMLIGVRYYCRVPGIQEKNQIKYILAAFSIVIIASWVSYVVFPLFQIAIPESEDLFFIIFSCLIGYAIQKHELFVINPATAADNIVSTMTDSLILLDDSHTIISVNEATLKILGYPKEGLIGRPVFTLFSNPSDSDTILSRITGDGPVTDFETAYRSYEGKTIPISFSGSVIKNAKGESTGIVCISRDITRSKQLKESLVENERRFHELADLLPQTVFEMDLQGSLTYVNDAGLKIFGIDDEKIRNGANVREYIIPGDFERMQQGLALVMSVTKSHEEIYTIKRLDGTLMSAIVFTGPIHRNGSVIGFRGIMIDITERVKLENALRESEEKYRALTENTLDLLFSTDMNGIITYVSPQVNKYGFSEDEVTGKTLRAFIYPADIDVSERNYSRGLKTGEQFMFRFRILDTWGTLHWFEEKSSLRRDIYGKPIGIYGILRDITEQKKIEDAVEAANKKLNLMNQITRHDIINTLTGLLGCIDMAKATTVPGEKEQLLDDIRELARLIQRQITFTREYQEVGVHLPQWQNVNGLINKAVQNFSKSGITFQSELENIEIYADPLLEKVFYNLMDNAIRYGETLTTISVYPKISDTDFSLIFEDNGVGVEPGQKREIFKRGVGKNTGMGLFLTEEILAITGISLEENGMYGKGARFEIRVPAGYWRFVTTGETETGTRVPRAPVVKDDHPEVPGECLNDRRVPRIHR